MECNYKWSQDNIKPKKQNRKRKQGEYFTLIYPSDRIKEAKFESSEQISTFLLNDALQIGFCNWQIYQKAFVDKGDIIKIVYKCRKKYCEAVLIYNQKKVSPKDKDLEQAQKQKYYLTEQKINNRHNHGIRLTPLIANQQHIRQYLYDLPVEDKIQNHVEVLKQKFSLTNCQARYLKQRVFWKFKDEDHMLKKLAQRKVSFRRNIQKGKTTILLIVSQTMKNSYQRYGDVICFDITYKLLKRKIGENKHLGVGFFVGQDENTRITLYGMSVIENETSENFQKLFQFFFEIVQHPPETIITDDQIAMVNAIERLIKIKKYKTIHLLDWFHRSEALKRAIKREPYGEQILSLACRLLKEPSKHVYLDILKQIAGILQNESIMKNFIKEQHKYCISFSPQKFIAFGISSTRAESFNNLIKVAVPFQSNISKLVYFVLRIEKRLLNRTAVLNYMNPQIYRGMKDPQMLMLSQKVQHLVFEQARQYYDESRVFEILPSKSPIHKFVAYEKYERPYKMSLMYDLKYNCWRCECRNNFRTGMPCSHLFAIIRMFRGCYSYYISDRWYHDKANARVKKASRPRLWSKLI